MGVICINGRIKIYSKATMLNQYSKMSLVLAITVLLYLFFDNSYVLAEVALNSTGFDFTLPFLPAVPGKVIIFSFFGVLSYVFLAPFKYGRDIWFYENAKKNRLSIRKLFSFYKGRKLYYSIKFVLSVQLRKLLIYFLFSLPATVLTVYIFYALREGVGRNLLFVLSVGTTVLYICSFFFSFVFSQRYFLAPFLYYENDYCRVRDVLSLSVKIMDKRCFETAFLKLSFAGWFLLCIFIFPTFYVYPFYKLSVSTKTLSLLTNTENNA